MLRRLHRFHGVGDAEGRSSNPTLRQNQNREGWGTLLCRCTGKGWGTRRLLNQEMAQLFFRRVKEQGTGLMSDEHFTVDGTLLQAWASQKSFQRKEGDGPEGTWGKGRFSRAGTQDRHAP